MKVRTHKDAIQEGREARKWYRQRNPAAERLFSASYKRGRKRLERFPRSGRLLDDEFRALQLREVPYAIIYRVHEGRIVIIAVAHNKREPGYWRDRVR